MLDFQGVFILEFLVFPLFFPLSGISKGNSYSTLSSNLAEVRLASLVVCA